MMEKTLKFIGLFLCVNLSIFAQNGSTIEVSSIPPNSYFFGDVGNIDIEPQASLFVESGSNSYQMGLFVSFYNIYDDNDVNDGTWLLIREQTSNNIVVSKQIKVVNFNGSGYNITQEQKIHIKAVAYMEFDKLAITGVVKAPSGIEYLIAGTFEIGPEIFSIRTIQEANSEGTVIARIGGTNQTMNNHEFIIAGVKHNYNGNTHSLIITHFDAAALSFSSSKVYDNQCKATDIIYHENNGIPSVLIGAATEANIAPTSCDYSPVPETRGIRFLTFQNLSSSLDLTGDFSVGGAYFYTSTGGSYLNMNTNYCHLKYDAATNLVIAVTDAVDWTDDEPTIGIVTYDINNVLSANLRMYGSLYTTRYNILTSADIEPLVNGNYVISVNNEYVNGASLNGDYRSNGTIEFDANDLNNTAGELYYFEPDALANLHGVTYECGYASYALTTFENSAFVSIGTMGWTTSVGNHVYLRDRDVTANACGSVSRNCCSREGFTTFPKCLTFLGTNIDEFGSPISGSVNVDVDLDNVSGHNYLCDGSPDGNFRKKSIQIKDNLEASSTNISLYPNPTTSNVVVSGLDFAADNATYEINILDQSGKLVLTRTLNKMNQKGIDVTQLESGMYFLKINNLEINFIEKLLISK